MGRRSSCTAVASPSGTFHNLAVASLVACANANDREDERYCAVVPYLRDGGLGFCENVYTPTGMVDCYNVCRDTVEDPSEWSCKAHHAYLAEQVDNDDGYEWVETNMVDYCNQHRSSCPTYCRGYRS